MKIGHTIWVVDKEQLNVPEKVTIEDIINFPNGKCGICVFGNCYILNEEVFTEEKDAWLGYFKQLGKKLCDLEEETNYIQSKADTAYNVIKTKFGIDLFLE